MHLFIRKEVLGKDEALCQKVKGVRPPIFEKKSPPKDGLAKKLQAIKHSDNFWV